MSDHLGIRVATKAHNEGRRAYKAGKSQRDNPYNGRSVRDSDEWLRYQGWHNGWNFAWVTDKDRVKAWRRS